MAGVLFHLRITTLSVVTCSLVGCAVPWWGSVGVSPRDFEAAAKETPPAAAITSPYGSSRDERARVESQYGSSSASADSSSSDASKPQDENKQALCDVLGQLKAQGAIDDAALAEMLKGVNDLEPSMVKHLTWMYRATLNDLNKPAPSAEHASRATATDATPAKSSTAESKPIVQAADKPLSKSASTAQSKPTAVENPVIETDPEPTPVQPVKAQPTAVQKPSPAQAAAAQESPPLESVPLDFPQSLARSITALEKNVGTASSDKSALRTQALLRMLYLTAGRREDALRPIEGLNETEQEYWTHQLYALSTYLDDERLTDPMRRSAEASRHLDQAARRLRESAGLTVRNLTFCSAVSSYGVYTPMTKSEVKPGQQLLLYAEVENFTSRETPQGYHTALKARYQLFDSKGTKADEHEFPVTEEHCQNPRRDYFVRYFLTVPQRLYDGKYTLQVTVEDTLGNKVGQGSIDLHVKQQPK